MIRLVIAQLKRLAATRCPVVLAFAVAAAVACAPPDSNWWMHADRGKLRIALHGLPLRGDGGRRSLFDARRTTTTAGTE